MNCARRHLGLGCSRFGYSNCECTEGKIFQKADALLEYWRQNNIQLAAPVLFHYEVVAVARKVVFQKRVTLEEAVVARDFMLLYEVETYLDEALLKRAYELATQFDRPTAYDAQYLAVAERLNCEFWTADEKLFNAVREGLSWVKWVGNFESHSTENPT